VEHLVATIFHVADLHLFVEEDGALRPPNAYARSVRTSRWVAKHDPLAVVRKVVSGFTAANMSALRQLRRRLPQEIRGERNRGGEGLPILILQTGDVETFGRSASRAAAGQEPFPSFAFLRNHLWPAAMAAGATDVIDMYGNHDVWSGSWPLCHPYAHVRNAFKHIATVPGLEGPWPARTVYAAAGGYRVEIYRVNSVAPSPLTNSFANGAIRRHPPGCVLPETGGKNVFNEILALTQKPSDVPGRPIRIAAMHHPPHFFEGSLFERFAGGLVSEAEGFARCCGRGGIQLVVAGHRHELNPADGEVYSGNTFPLPQPPLNASTAQLVSESPTADSDVASVPARNSFSRYRILVNGTSATLRIERTTFRYRDAAPMAFAPGPSQDVFRDIPLE
jgi:Calcineurin-like phosphoesterase